jgi:hypothetical protein
MSEKIISFGVTAEEFQKIQKEAEQKNMSISMYCKSLIISEANFIKYYNHLIKKIEKFPLGISFTIRDLMGDEIWDKIPKGIKLSMGRQFYTQVNNGILANIKVEGYGAAKTMRYSKKK